MYLFRTLKRIGTSDYCLLPKELKEMVGIKKNIKISIEPGKIIIENNEENEENNDER